MAAIVWVRICLTPCLAPKKSKEKKKKKNFDAYLKF
jgi:hypothetical protein